MTHHAPRTTKRPGGRWLHLLAISLLGFPCLAQTNFTALTTNSAPIGIETNSSAWDFTAFSYTYVVPDSRDYVQLTFAANHDWLHLEARYNYEALDTGSAWLGYNLEGGNKVKWTFTPMFGGVFGDVNGVAPGYQFQINWWKLEFYSEAEYVRDFGEPSASFLYNWNEFSVYPLEWLRVGMVTQRNLPQEGDNELWRGFLVGATYKSLSFATYVFNPGASTPTLVFALGVKF